MQATIALAGNPNSGKTTMFNALTGSNQYVGNWPGVTVEKKEGKLRTNKEVTVTDLPGTYSLSPYSPEEIVSRDYLLHGSAGAILNLVDGTNLERNLYLTTQMMEVGLPVVIALNMVDLVEKSGDKIDVKKLSKALGCPIIETSALKNKNVKEAAETAVKAIGSTFKSPLKYSSSVEEALAAIAAVINGKAEENRTRWYTVKLFERDEKVQQELGLSEAQLKTIEAAITTVEDAMDDDSESIITGERYDFIGGLMAACVKKSKAGLTTSDKIDRIVTNRWLAIPIFAVIMVAVYFVSVTWMGDLATGFMEDLFEGVGEGVAEWMEGLGSAEWLVSLVEEGIIGGVGAVLSFIPQMVILFAFLAFLEGCGYMARVAFIMDRIFRKFGLSGKSFIPMLISSGCGVPGIMATKTIENEKDRRMTVITTTFIPCGAKLPIIALLAGAILGYEDSWWVAPAFYFLGVIAVIVSGIILKKTKMFEGDPAPFVMELPQYHLPSARNMLMVIWERARAFIVKAGTVIFASAIVVWFLLSFGFEGGSFGMVDVEDSIFAMIGSIVAVLFAPLGFGNWEAMVGTLTGIVAKENLVSTLGILSGMSDAAADALLENTQPLWGYVTTTLLPNGVPAILSFLAFNLLCAPCFAAIGAIAKQMNSAKWTWFAIGYQTIFAYAVALIIYQFGVLITGAASFGIGTIAAILVLGLLVYLLVRPGKKRNTLSASKAA